MAEAMNFMRWYSIQLFYLGQAMLFHFMRFDVVAIALLLDHIGQTHVFGLCILERETV